MSHPKSSGPSLDYFFNFRTKIINVKCSLLVHHTCDKYDRFEIRNIQIKWWGTSYMKIGLTTDSQILIFAQMGKKGFEWIAHFSCDDILVLEAFDFLSRQDYR